jgi:hypothetical protein
MTYKRHHGLYELSNSTQTARADDFMILEFSSNSKIAELQKLNVFVIRPVSLKKVLSVQVTSETWVISPGGFDPDLAKGRTMDHARSGGLGLDPEPPV